MNKLSLKMKLGVGFGNGGMITQIATAATEQSSTSEQVNHNVDQIAKLVKESALGAQQSAKACQDLSSLALDLQNMVGKFKLGNRGQGRDGRLRRSAGFASDDSMARPKARAVGMR